MTETSKLSFSVVFILIVFKPPWKYVHKALWDYCIKTRGMIEVVEIAKTRYALLIGKLLGFKTSKPTRIKVRQGVSTKSLRRRKVLLLGGEDEDLEAEAPSTF